MQLRAEGGVAVGADVLAHLERRDRVERPAGGIPVVLDPHLGPVGQAEPAQPLPGVAALLGREGDRGDPGTAVLRGVHRERPPPAAQVEQGGVGTEPELLRHQVELVPLGVGEAVARFVAGPVPARVGHRGIEDQPVEGDRNVVVARDHGPVPGPAVPAAGVPDLGFRRLGPRPDTPSRLAASAEAETASAHRRGPQPAGLPAPGRPMPGRTAPSGPHETPGAVPQ